VRVAQVDRSALTMPALDTSEVSGERATVVVAAALLRTLAPVFADQREVTLIGVFDPSTDSVSKLTQLTPDVLLLAADMKQPSLFQFLREIQAEPCAIKTLIVTDRCDHEFIGTILRYGARGCVRTVVSHPYVIKAILAVKEGDIWLERKLLAEAVAALTEGAGTAGIRAAERDQHSYSSLTGRERKIVALLSAGMTNKEIANELNVSIETVKKHLRTIFLKLGVRRRTQVVLSRLCDRIILSQQAPRFAANPASPAGS
jgi:two-component system, NarL family, nitrate/nitrite response regulator NarL